MTQHTDEHETVALLDGRYELHERLGAGGMAEVFRAEDTFLRRTVAVKMLRSEADALASPVRAQREVSALSAVAHPALVTLLDAQIAPDRQRYLVMEFVDGPTLAQRLYTSPLTMEQVGHLASELGAGLRAVHDAGLVHRDVKPSNILLAPSAAPSREFHVKLADFGLAQLADAAPLTTPGVVIGTAAYLAPEQVRGESCGSAADIYAFGLVLLEAITGERAFPHASGIGAVIARLVESPEIPSGLDPRWADLLRRMLSAEPAERPSALEVLHAVAEVPAPAVRPAADSVRREEPSQRDAATALPAAPRLSDDTAPRPVRRRGVRRLSRSLVLAASVAGAGVICAATMLTGPASSPSRSAAAEEARVEYAIPGVLPSAPSLIEAADLGPTASEEQADADPTTPDDTADAAPTISHDAANRAPIASHASVDPVASVASVDVPAVSSPAPADAGASPAPAAAEPGNGREGGQGNARDAVTHGESSGRDAAREAAVQQRGPDDAVREAAQAGEKGGR
ncbi:serine/threonine-protein kinase [Microbacterium sp. BK668]|uniref:serine/threonine-protein kinase n=1 Tax=Microbacterium sp. BK668 TaxID=2512118 RepID=UPI00105C203F|nr:serine/threonine-protein kinase [Microbacterium sp. BK668]TDN92077.1 serine/threonine protein kinase [Microbacterium sp. BK668]